MGRIFATVLQDTKNQEGQDITVMVQESVGAAQRLCGSSTSQENE